ncbi:UNVERIFIED_CONTAM: hypothetical protein NCL1_15165 [Trichonephila clavipes]
MYFDDLFPSSSIFKSTNVIKNGLIHVALYHIHYIWHSRERSRESGQPNGRLHNTCKNAVPRTIPFSLGRVD